VSWATHWIAQLQAGHTVEFRPRGNSMVPLIHSGDLCRVEPLDGRALERGDIVLCRVQGRQYLHLVSAVRPGQVQISNNRGHVNGWCTRDQVYGILVR
jgi:phage repressor protein C with HTH and peptisase S24 domain